VLDDYCKTELNPCNVCFRAKQAYSTFNISDSKVNDLFEIIHCDIWGSYQIPIFCGAHDFWPLTMMLIEQFGFIWWEKKGEVIGHV